MNAMNFEDRPLPDPNGAERSLPPELMGLEAQLAALRPREDRLDRERLMFEAGRASGEAERPPAFARWGWPASFAAMSSVAAALLATLLLDGERGGGQIRGVNEPFAAESLRSATDGDASATADASGVLRVGRQSLGMRPLRSWQGVYTAGMPVRSVENLLRSTPSQFADGAPGNQARVDGESTPTFSPRSIDEALSESLGSGAPS